jgi:hypothetical protein
VEWQVDLLRTAALLLQTATKLAAELAANFQYLDGLQILGFVSFASGIRHKRFTSIREYYRLTDGLVVGGDPTTS